MWVSRYLVWFVVYSVFGWIYESTYCTIVERKWANRGFLYGPLCPIYGTGVIAMIAAWQAVQDAGIAVAPWQVFLVTALGTAVLEYVTSWAMEKLFDARWWDYTDMPLNVNGRICLPATVLFGLAGIGCIFVAEGALTDLTHGLGLMWCEVLALLFCCIMSVDTGVTVSALTRFAQVATSVTDSVNEHMEQFVAGVFEQGDAAQAQIAAERERFPKSMRESRIAQMGQSRVEDFIIRPRYLVSCLGGNG
jgi:uncharacterized membrane protein